MKKLSKLRLPLIERELSVLNEEELRAYIGGQKQSCVFNCFDYLDGSLHSANDYYNWTKQGLGYEPDEHGNVDISDVGTIGGYGGFNVSKVNSGESFILRSDGQTSNGERVMAVFAVGSESNEEGHAVVISVSIELMMRESCTTIMIQQVYVAAVYLVMIVIRSTLLNMKTLIPKTMSSR